MTVLFLDDCPYRTQRFRSENPGATCVATAAEMIEQLEQAGNVDKLFLDHDLGGMTYVDSSDEETGMEVVRWIEKHKPAISHIIVHTLNSSAGWEMQQKLQDAGYSVEYIRFINLDVKTHKFAF